MIEIFQLFNLYNVKTIENNFNWIINEIDYKNNNYDGTTKQEIIVIYCNKIIEDYEEKYQNYVIKLLQNTTMIENFDEFHEIFVVYRVSIVFIKLILQLDDNEIEWQTIQIISKIIDKFYYFYYLGYITYINESNIDSNKQDIGITWIEFCQLQEVNLSPHLTFSLFGFPFTWCHSP